MLGGNTTAALTPPEPTATEEATGAFLSSVTVQGFRGIGPETTLSVSTGPGLTLVVGRNGSGKSSFAESLEVLFTGDSGRWMNRSKVWEEGWRNLHHPHPATIEAEFVVQGAQPTRVGRQWEQEADLRAATAWSQEHGKPKSGIADLGWKDALTTYKPFLSYNELGSMLDEGPSKLYDALSVVLGLEDLVEAKDLLGAERRNRKKQSDEARRVAKQLIARITEADQPDDERFARCLELLDAKPWDVAAIGKLVVGDDDGSAHDLEVLRRTSVLEVVDVQEATARASRLRDAHATSQALEDSDAARSLKLADLLDQSLKFHEHADSADCPVCGTAGVLDSGWRESVAHHAGELRAAADELTRAQKELRAAREALESMLTAPPPALRDLGAFGIDAASGLELWEQWDRAREIPDHLALAEQIEYLAPQLANSAASVADSARRELESREERWKPIAMEVAGWIGAAEAAQNDTERLSDIKSAEDWLKTAMTDLRNDRFEPIAQKAISTWNHLRQQSNVELAQIQLAGGGSQRRVALEVNVDGVAGAALGVMSQGELNSLALSLFLPRATLPESPFRFIVIDDPVQSMDPARVDGLARALEDAARTHQVIVFTHDERLPEATRRLGVECRMIKVTRRADSVVELRQARHPVKTYVDDALAVCLTKNMPADVIPRVVPGLCRSALEAASIEVIRRRRLSRGESHADVEDLIVSAGKLNTLMALALHDDGGRAGDVMSRLNQWGAWAGDVYKNVNKGAHKGYSGDLEKMAKDTERLANKVLELR